MRPVFEDGRQRGGILLEVLVALTVLAIVASTAAWLTQESIRAVDRTYAAEAELRRAHRLMTAVSLWPREDLDRHLGATVQGDWRMTVERVASTLYEVTISDGSSGTVLLRAGLFRDLPERYP